MVSVGEFLVLILGAVAATSLGNRGASYEITVDGKKVASGKLNSMSKKQINVPVKKGTAKVIMENGTLYVPRMDKHLCPKGICTSMGAISQPGQSIVCIPTKMVVRII
ncbi:hypothetical protein Desor_3832 [Desulfosporosinus orientis DSM 765]|uniref:Uncharacterized protein n=1 Tax=Desulfosporosinus orientis (strain ATCC 19365 / DSM 765 / NCIMB 8382 / VKM B-1628 / Singapore I) TaxID=768706 RepID=G7W9F3_DESOD|nr:NusG domain II-containing protein [Desulfosporosinus orientis]AET69290.1 hypothetical protein Desor_3832 [Desulfosporosinus orientis DSM 765]